MKSKEEIINDSIKLETPPGDYNTLFSSNKAVISNVS